MKGQLNTLRLVFPPFSNQEGDWMWEQPEYRKTMQDSKLYMIGQREEIFFDAPVGTEDGCLQFDLTYGESRFEKLKLVLPAKLPDPKGGGWDLEIGKKIIRVLDEDGEVVRWFTPDKLLFEYWRNTAEVEGLERFRDLTVFNLHYVGISKKGDSFSRLFEAGPTHLICRRTVENTHQIALVECGTQPLGFDAPPSGFLL